MGQSRGTTVGVVSMVDRGLENGTNFLSNDRASASGMASYPASYKSSIL